LLEQVVAATKQTEPDRAQELVKTLVEQALAGTVTFDRNLTRTFERAIATCDRMLSAQLNEIMHTMSGSGSSKAAGAGCTTSS
jgi:type VI secretion system protein ImpC